MIASILTFILLCVVKREARKNCDVSTAIHLIQFERIISLLNSIISPFTNNLQLISYHIIVSTNNSFSQEFELID